MVYGDKFISSIDSVAVIESEIHYVDGIIKSINEDYFTEGIIKKTFDAIDKIDAKYNEILDKIYGKFKEIMVKILEAISKIVHKIFPFLYKYTEKMVADIKNDGLRYDEKIKFKGKLSINYKEFSDEGNKFIKDIIDDKLTGYVDLSQDIIDDYIHHKYDIESYNDKVDDLKQSFASLFDKHYSKVYDNEDKLTIDVEDEIEESSEYFRLKDMLHNSLSKNKETKDQLEAIQRQIKYSISRAKAGYNKIAGVPNDFNTIGSKMITTISGLYKIALDTSVSLFKSQFETINKISKYRVSEFNLSNDVIYRDEIPTDFKEL